MSEANKAVLLRANAAIVTGKYEGFLAHCTDDVVWDFVGEQTLRGKAAVRAYTGRAYARPARFVVHHLITDADFVTAVGEITLNDDAGRAVHYDYCDVRRVRGGRLADLKAFVVATADGSP